MYSSNTQRESLSNLVASCKVLPEYSDTIHPPTPTMGGLCCDKVTKREREKEKRERRKRERERERGNSFLLCSRDFTSCESFPQPSHSNIKQHGPAPCSVYIRPRQSAFHFSILLNVKQVIKRQKQIRDNKNKAGNHLHEKLLLTVSRDWSVAGTSGEYLSIKKQLNFRLRTNKPFVK